jgi:hypothetical protein
MRIPLEGCTFPRVGTLCGDCYLRRGGTGNVSEEERQNSDTDVTNECKRQVNVINVTNDGKQQGQAYQYDVSNATQSRHAYESACPHVKPAWF